MTGPDTKCYLIYDKINKDAAIIDVAGSIDSLFILIKKNKLNLKYFFFTHGHFDHVMGLLPLRNEFPNAQVCINQDDYIDMQVQLE